MLLNPTPLQQSTILLQPWPRPLRVAAPWEPGLLNFYHLGLVRGCLRARLLFEIFHPACEGLQMGSPSKMFFPGSLREVCRLLFSLPPLHKYFLAEVFALLVRQPTRPLQP